MPGWLRRRPLVTYWQSIIPARRKTRLRPFTSICTHAIRANDTAMQLTLLGTGSARQLPVYNCECVACARARREPRYRRGPCSAVLECGGTRWLIDAGHTDLAERFPPGSLSGILQTHYHADHAQGLLHLRWGVNLRIPVLGPPDPEGLADLYKHPGILDFSKTLTPFVPEDLG